MESGTEVDRSLPTPTPRKNWAAPAPAVGSTSIDGTLPPRVRRCASIHDAMARVAACTAAILLYGNTLSMANANANTNAHSIGTLVGCDGANYQQCLWSDANGHAVGRFEMMRQLMAAEKLDIHDDEIPRRRLEMHVQYIEDVYRHAREQGVSFPYAMGVNERHLYLDDTRTQSPREFVESRRLDDHADQQEGEAPPAAQPRHLGSLPTSLNWCTDDNPLKKSVCSSVRHQVDCGACWAFAAVDVIESAIAIQTGRPVVALSAQQLMECSRGEAIGRFEYCWAKNRPLVSLSFGAKKGFVSRNNACEGGNAFTAYEDMATHGIGLISEQELPYTDNVTDTTGSRNGQPRNELKCAYSTQDASAFVTGWAQAAGDDCSISSDANEQLKIALQAQTISVSMFADSAFRVYKGGIFECSANSFLFNEYYINHALVLVGYGSENGIDYWILKNSYGYSWGENGFMRIRMDSSLNCGINLLPVIPMGVTKGGATQPPSVRSLTPRLLGLSPLVWCVFAAVAVVTTAVLTVVGVIVQGRRREAMRASPPWANHPY